MRDVPENLPGPFSDIEIQIASLLQQGLTRVEIAEKLSISPAEVRDHLMRIRAKTRAPKAGDDTETRFRFTSREIDVAEMLRDGETNKSMARKWGISPRTVEIHRSRMLQKINASTSIIAVLKMIARGYIEPYRDDGS